MFYQNPSLFPPYKKNLFWSGKMTKTKKLLLELEKRISRLEAELNQKNDASYDEKSSQASYGEVIDEWLNGKKC